MPTEYEIALMNKVKENPKSFHAYLQQGDKQGKGGDQGPICAVSRRIQTMSYMHNSPLNSLWKIEMLVGNVGDRGGRVSWRYFNSRTS